MPPNQIVISPAFDRTKRKERYVVVGLGRLPCVQRVFSRRNRQTHASLKRNHAFHEAPLPLLPPQRVEWILFGPRSLARRLAAQGAGKEKGGEALLHPLSPGQVPALGRGVHLGASSHARAFLLLLLRTRLLCDAKAIPACAYDAIVAGCLFCVHPPKLTRERIRNVASLSPLHSDTGAVSGNLLSASFFSSLIVGRC